MPQFLLHGKFNDEIRRKSPRTGAQTRVGWLTISRRYISKIIEIKLRSQSMFQLAPQDPEVKQEKPGGRAPKARVSSAESARI